MWNLTWQANGPVPGDYTTFAHLFDSSGVKVAQADAPPREGYWPTSRWRPSEPVTLTLAIDLPPNLPPGQYILGVGMYDATNGQRLFAYKPGGSEWRDRVIVLEVRTDAALTGQAVMGYSISFAGSSLASPSGCPEGLVMGAASSLTVAGCARRPGQPRLQRGRHGAQRHGKAGIAGSCSRVQIAQDDRRGGVDRQGHRHLNRELLIEVVVFDGQDGVIDAAR